MLSACINNYCRSFRTYKLKDRYDKGKVSNFKLLNRLKKEKSFLQLYFKWKSELAMFRFYFLFQIRVFFLVLIVFVLFVAF